MLANLWRPTMTRTLDPRILENWLEAFAMDFFFFFSSLFSIDLFIFRIYIILCWHPDRSLEGHMTRSISREYCVC